MPKTDNALFAEISENCLLTRTRKIARVVTGIYDQELRPHGINSPQFSLMVVIGRLGPASRAEIGRANYQDRSTLTRNLQPLLAEGWIEEIESDEGGRRRPIRLTKAGRLLLGEAAGAWRTAQEKARDILGNMGVNAVMDMAGALPLQVP
ncbi:MAG TPA: MarR family transcriptional regulator [Luteibacter sp.]|jgi:DNA-binding MarR family transcriptional regulator|nr:MarR family transcriptional regulator [Luteibacter sp.]